MESLDRESFGESKPENVFEELSYRILLLKQIDRFMVNGDADCLNDTHAYNRLVGSLRGLETLLDPEMVEDEAYNKEMEKLYDDKKNISIVYQRMRAAMRLMMSRGMIVDQVVRQRL